MFVSSSAFGDYFYVYKIDTSFLEEKMKAEKIGSLSYLCRQTNIHRAFRCSLLNVCYKLGCNFGTFLENEI